MALKNQCFLSFNARSLFNKMGELTTLLNSFSSPPLFISVCETWCVPNEPDNLYALQNYQLFRRDRIGKAGGGLLIYVHLACTTSIRRLHELETPNEDLWIEVAYRGSSRPLFICSTYRPPNLSLAQSNVFFTNFEQSLRKFSKNRKACYRIILGDFNAKNREWYGDVTDNCGENLLHLSNVYNLPQLVDFPTHIYSGQLNSALDLVLSDVPGMQASALPPLGSSDHVTIQGSWPIPRQVPKSQQRNKSEPQIFWSWEKADISSLRDAIEKEDWSDIHLCQDVNKAWIRWKAKIMCLATRFIPHHTKPKNQQGIFQSRPWVTDEIKHQVKEKHRLFRRFKASRLDDDWEKFKKQRNRVSAVLRSAKSAFVSGLPQNNSDRNQPRLYELLRCLLKSRNSVVPDLVSASKIVAKTDQEKANLLNQFFVSQSQKAAGDDGPLPDTNTFANRVSKLPEAERTSLENFVVLEADVRKELEGLNPRKASGFDGVSVRLLKTCGSTIAPCLTRIFNLSLATASLPDDWKEATITPIFKKGNRSSPNNYRPVSLLSSTSKILESLVARQLRKLVDCQLPINQSGFRKGDSTSQQLARIMHQLAKHVEDGDVVVSCFYDLSKAFDTVWHKGLLFKLEALGVVKDALAWVASYLRDRRQRVRIGSSFSTWQRVPAGVPQGSVLGPLLFLCYTFDLPSSVRPPVDCDQFADDTALVSAAPCLQDAISALQETINSTGEWLRNWRLSANTEKTKVMVIRRGRSPFSANVNLYGKTLEHVANHRHLGIVLSSDLRWTGQVDSIVAKVSRLLAVLKRLRGSLSREALSVFYVLYIRPQIEYASVAWSNLTGTLNDKLERLQRKAAKIILGFGLYDKVDHHGLLSALNWPTLSSRRLLHLAKLGHSIKHSYAPEHVILAARSFLLPTVVEYPLRHRNALNTPIPRTSTFQSSPLFFSCSVFNSLPPSIQSISSPHKFRTAAANHLLSSVCTCSSSPFPH